MQSRFYLIIISITLYLISFSVTAQSEFEPITLNNVGQLSQIYSFGGECGAFSPDETSIATTTGLYDLNSGAARVDMSEEPVASSEWILFSPDGKWIVMGAAIYQVETGEQVLSQEYPQAFIVFSDNGQFAYVNGILYDTENWDTIDFETVPDFEFFGGQLYVWRDVTSGNGIQTYLSSQKNYWVHPVEGIYNVNTGELVALPDELNNPMMLYNGIFSPNDRMFFIGGDGLDTYVAYTVPDFERAYELTFDIGRPGYYYAEFSPNNLYFAARDEGVYQTISGEFLFDIVGEPRFSLDNVWVGTGDGLYLLPTGQLVQEFSGSSWVMDFSENNELLAVFPDGVFDLFIDDKRFDIDDVVREMSFNQDSTLLFASTIIPELWIYDTETSDVLQKLPGTQPLISANERFIALSVPNQGCSIYAIVD